MIKEAGFLWPISHGESASLLLAFFASLFLCFFVSCLLCFSVSLFLVFFASLPAVSFGFSCRVSISSQRDFSRISVGFLWDFCGISAGFSIIHKSVDKCTENHFNNFLITCGISTFPYLHPRDYGYPQGY